MKRAILFPLKTESTNVAFGENARFINASRAKKQRAAVATFLRDARVGAPPPQDVIAHGVRVELCRVFSGQLDWDNLVGALKHVRDEVAVWLGRDDRDPVLDFDYFQQPCERGPAYVRVSIEDCAPGRDLDVTLGPGPKRLGEITRRGGGGIPKAHAGTRAPSTPKAAATALPLLRSLVLLPWDQEADGVPVWDELELGPDAPPFVNVDVPPVVPGLRPLARAELLRIARRVLRLERHLVVHEVLPGGRAWVYAEPRSPALRWFGAYESTSHGVLHGEPERRGPCVHRRDAWTCPACSAAAEEGRTTA